MATALTAAAPAAAQMAKGLGARLNQEEGRQALLGVDITGFSPTYRMAWRECIQPDGQTLYETPGNTQHGRMVVDVDGHACFAYADTDFQSWGCFRIVRARDGLRFEEKGGGGVFVTTSIRRGVTTCKPDDDLIG